ncbi:MAG: o-succinylbenzoate synthase [Lysinibacillus sp.]
MKVTEVTVRTLKMRMKFPFETSFGVLQDKEFLVLEAKTADGLIGYGEGVAFTAPWYTEETVTSMEHVLTQFLIPAILNKEIAHPDDLQIIFNSIRRNAMAKACLEGAFWDLYAQRTKQSLAKAIGGTEKRITVGVSIGIQPTIEQLLSTIDAYLKEGYKRIKIKIKPGWDIDVVKAIRTQFGEIPLMVDANSAYTLKDIERLKELDAFNLLMIEQPLAYDDIVDHAKLQRVMTTPICLDESINSFDDARRAIELGSCKVINIKIGRVGGITVAKQIHDYCKEHSIPVWCGGMLEAGIGRAHNVAMTSLSNFTLPGDTAASSRYWEQDIIEPQVMVHDGWIDVPTQIGIGYEVNQQALEQFTIKKLTFN